MYVFKEIRINKNVAIRNYSSSDNKNIKLNEWGIWIKMNPTSKTMTKEEKNDLFKITNKSQGVVPDELIDGPNGIIKKYGCAEIIQSKGSRSVNILKKFKHNVKINFDFRKFLNDKSIYKDSEPTNMFDIDTSKLPKTRLGIPILP